MLTRLYIDNYKAFQNFEYTPTANELILGRNGTGKSSAFDVLGVLRALITEDASVADLLGPRTLTRPFGRLDQRFEIDVDNNGAAYRYSMAVEYTEKRDKWRIDQEMLQFREPGESGWHRLFARPSPDDGHLFRDDTSEGPTVLLDWNRSGLARILPRGDNTRLTWFKERVARIHCVRINPCQMQSATEKDANAPATDLANYASWYQYLLHEEPGIARALETHLKDVIDGFDTFSLPSVGEDTRSLRALVRSADGKREAYLLEELSDGQRALIGLYTLAAVLSEYAISTERPITLCIDEPENYVALAELQPWLHEIEDAIEGRNAQVLVASHHPEFIDHYVHTQAVLFYRENGGPVRTKPFTGLSDRGVLASELVARGWEDD